MKELKTYTLTLSVLLAQFVLNSCSDAPEPGKVEDDNVYPLVVHADIKGKATARATHATIDDKWSYVGFTQNDQMGIFSSGGNAQDNNGPFVNQALTYNDDGMFDDPSTGATFSVGTLNGSEVLLYFPYDANISTTGMTLRVNGPGGSSERCIDLLTTNQLEIMGNNAEQVALYGTMQHAFSELIIMRGEGFDAPPEGLERITVVLQNPYTSLKVTTNNDDGWSYSMTLQNDGSLESSAARSWVAWQGGNYGITLEDTIGTPAWYVIVPTLPQSPSTVEYIELYDNQGFLQRVSSLALDGNTKNVQPSWRYPLVVTMKELVPTVNPFPILPWEQNVNLTDQRMRGINNMYEFSHFVSDYNAYLADPTDEDKIAALLNYGDKIVDTEAGISWHFYVLNDLDFTTYTPLPYVNAEGEEVQPGTDVIIPKLVDILDGVSTTISGSQFLNHTLSGLTTPFIGQLGENSGSQTTGGTLQNFDFIEPDIKYDNTMTQPVGIIAISMNASSVINCNILDGTLICPAAQVGMVAGTMTNGGSVKDCYLSGLLYGAGITRVSEAQYIIGDDPSGNYTFDGNVVSDITTELQ